jgi:hypothetical protein
MYYDKKHRLKKRCFFSEERKVKSEEIRGSFASKHYKEKNLEFMHKK